MRNALPFRPFLKRLAYRAYHAPRYQGGQIKIAGYTIQYLDLLSLYIEYKDIFAHRIYHFETTETSPYIIDGGGCIGLSVLYFKSVYPQARLVVFEPDPHVFATLKHNIEVNALQDVLLVQAGLSGRAGADVFVPDGIDGGRIALPTGKEGIVVTTVKLSDYLTEPVDFLKLNIEGYEWPVLEEAAASGRLRQVREMVVEYHGWPHGEQNLGAILMLLEGEGYRYLVHDFDPETGPASKPPFRIRPDTTWYCLIYACREDLYAQVNA